MGGAVAEGALQLQHDLAGAITLEPFVGNGGARDIAAQALELRALTGATAHRRMQTEAVRIGAQCWRGGFAATGDGLQAQHLVSGARPKGDSIRAGGGLQGLERVIGIDVGHVSHALLFDEIAVAGQHFHEARDDLGE